MSKGLKNDRMMWEGECKKCRRHFRSYMLEDLCEKCRPKKFKKKGK